MTGVGGQLQVGELIKNFFPKMDDKPFASEDEQRQAFMGFLDLLCLIAMEYGPGGSVGSLHLSEEATRLLLPESKGEYLWQNTICQLFDKLMVKGIGPKGSPQFLFGRILGQGLSRLEILAVLMALSISVDRKYERIYGLLQEEREDISAPTVGLCVDMARFFLPKEERRARQLMTADSFFNRCLVRREEETWFSRLSRPLVLEPYILSCLLGREPGGLKIKDLPDGRKGMVFSDGGQMGRLYTCAKRLLPPEGDGLVHPELESELTHVLAKGGGRLVELSGESGSGRRYLLRSAGAKTGRFVLAVDMMAFGAAGSEEQEGMLRELLARGIFERELLCLWNIPKEQVTGGSLSRVLSFLLEELPIVAIAVEKPLKQEVLISCGLPYRLSVPQASTAAQKMLWERVAAAQELAFEEGLSLDEVVSKYMMNPGRIVQTISNVLSAAKERGLIERKTLEEQIRRICGADFGDNATRISSPFTRKDLVIDAAGERLLTLAIDRIRLKSMVNENFGFGRKLPYGRGCAIVFYGPPGTGKTMAAQVMARELGLDIYRIDLSQVSSKYIGETEKNLGAVFEAAKNSNAILFFDEADALFSKRTEVSSSNDKYANAETSYLLQKIEEYPGVSILATNNMQNFDAAFKRRMTYLIPIEAPDEITRRGLWEAAFPPEAPLDEEVDTRLLAQALQLTGAQIKSIALAGAYRAAAKGATINYEDLIAAVNDEGEKAGRLGEGEKLRQAIMTGFEE